MDTLGATCESPKLALDKGDRRAILVVDDDLGIRETLHWVLRAHGFQVTTAGSGARGLALGRSSRFDLLLIDLRLPDVSGMDMVRSLQREGSEVPFVLVSAFVTDPVAREARELGAIGVWAKPLTIDDVVVNVRAALSGNA